jgi:hypothetical protein
LHLHKTSGAPSIKTESEGFAKNVQEKNRVQAERASAQVQPAKLQPVQSKSSTANNTAKSGTSSISLLISSVKLPVDKLSASIVLFARFFSLPLKHEILSSIRRQALMPQDSVIDQTEKNKSEITKSESLKQAEESAGDSALKNIIEKNRQAFSLAATATESKGAELDTKGLELYANAIDPDLEKRQNSGGHDGQKNKKQDQQNNEDENINSGPINVNTLKKIVLESEEQNTLLYILNRIPCKDGKRWIVLPFNINENGKEYRVSLRILSDTLKRVSLMTLDIIETGDLEKRSIFTLKAVDGIINTLNIYMQPELPPKAKHQLEKELSGLLNIPVSRVSVRKSNDSFPLELGNEDELFRSIDEAV